MSTQAEALAIYRQAERNIKQNPTMCSPTDKFIVDMWNASKKMHDDNVALKQELSDTQRRAADHFRKIDILESKVERLMQIKKELEGTEE